MGIGNDRPQNDQEQSDMDLLRSGVEEAKRRLQEGRIEKPPEEEKPAPKKRRASKRKR